MNHNEGTFSGPRDLQIYHQSWLPDQEPAAVLLIVHGLAEHSGRYGNLVEYFLPKGYAIYGLDHIGHGKSGGARVYVKRFVEFIKPLRTLHESIKEEHPGKPIFIVGHSLGGLISSLYIANYQEDLAGGIISGPLTQLPEYITPLTIFLANLFSALLPKAGMVKIDSEGISRDPRVVQAYDNDPLVYRGKNTARLGAETISAMKYLDTLAGEITLPLLILQGSDDPVVDPKGAQILHDQVASPDKTLRVFEGLYHEVYNEPEHTMVMKVVEDWLNDHIG